MLRNSQEPLIGLAQIAKLVASPSPNLSIVNMNYGGNPEGPDFTYLRERIPSSRFINIAQIGDKSLRLANYLPTPETFLKTMKELDIGVNDHIICYGDDNLVGPSRGWYMFKVFGFPNVQVINGLFPEYKKEGHPVETGTPTWSKIIRKRTADDFNFKYNKELIVTMDQIRKQLEQKTSNQLVDARPSKAFKDGHIPSAINLTFTDLLVNGSSFKPEKEIRALLQEKQIDTAQPIQVSCNTGMTASVLLLGLYLAGARDISNYVGSWGEWSKHRDNPIEK
jgi:thiosulfate/3-mercaptopyruvate sulfurtransferase